MAVYELPELDYAYDALEPHISAENPLGNRYSVCDCLRYER